MKQEDWFQPDVTIWDDDDVALWESMLINFLCWELDEKININKQHNYNVNAQ